MLSSLSHKIINAIFSGILVLITIILSIAVLVSISNIYIKSLSSFKKKIFTYSLINFLN